MSVHGGGPPRGALDPETLELEQLRAVVRQQSTQTVGQFIDGLSWLLEAAGRGEPRAVAIVEELDRQLDRLKSFRAGIVIPHG